MQNHLMSSLNRALHAPCKISKARRSLCLLEQLVRALRANDPDLFKRWLCGGVQDLGKHVVEELLLDWLAPFLNEAEKDRLIAWKLLVNL